MSRHHTALLGFAVLAVTLLACANLGDPSTLPIGESAPNFGIQVDGKVVALENLRGSVVVVIFWSST